MRCRNCDYSLWNLKARQCPECGVEFRPSEFEFLANSVRFCCPHCDQSYYGIDQRGHLDPKQFECVQCHKNIDMDEMVLRPAAGVDESITSRDRMPWFERQRLGTFKSWWKTIGCAMSRPSSLIRAVPREQSAYGAWWFMFLTNLVFQIIGMGIPLLFAGIVIWLIGRNTQGMNAITTQLFLQQWWQFPLAIFMLAGVPILWMWLSHLLLQAVGAANEPMRRTAHCIYYSSPANALSAIPCGDCTQFAGKVWWLVSAILMVKEAHHCSGGKATFAVLVAAFISWGLSVGVAIAVAFLFMGNIFASPNMTNINASITGQIIAPIVVSGLKTYAAEHDGQAPGHALELVIDPGIDISSFAITTNVMNIPVEDSNLAMFDVLTPTEQRVIVDRVLEDWPNTIIAHRFGDLIFTYHGVDIQSSDPRLWVLLVWPQSMNANPGPGSYITISYGDGSTDQIKPSQFAAELVTQNRQRQSAGLPPLPSDLLSITPDQPVVSAGVDETDMTTDDS